MIKKQIKESLKQYHTHLITQEKTKNTIDKYLRDIENFSNYLGKEELSKEVVVKWKEQLQQHYAPSSINSMISSLNNYLDWIDKGKCKVRCLKIQRTIFQDPSKELTSNDYKKLIEEAFRQKDEALSVLIQTLGSTGIRISEIQFVTVEGVNRGSLVIDNKGKNRKILLQKDLIKLLKIHSKNQNIKTGIIFRTKTGKALDRSNIWKKLKKLCEKIGVDSAKVFPHNLRKLFARTFYKLQKDISKLADLLGHASINTTRIYIMENGKEHIKQLDKMGLIYGLEPKIICKIKTNNRLHGEIKMLTL